MKEKLNKIQMAILHLRKAENNSVMFYDRVSKVNMPVPIKNNADFIMPIINNSNIICNFYKRS